MNEVRIDESKHILLIDILGYKALCKKHSIEDLFQIIGRFITRSAEAGKFIGAMRSYVFADTIVFIPEEQNNDTLAALVRIANIILQTNIYYWQCGEEYIPIRGAIGYGEIRFVGPSVETRGGAKTLIANNVMMVLGKGLLDAYEAEQKLELMGICLSVNAIGGVVSPRIDELVRNLKLVNYECPVKTNKKNEAKVVGKEKMYLVFPVPDKSKINDNATKIHKLGEGHPDDVREKYENSAKFILHSAELWKKFLAASNKQ